MKQPRKALTDWQAPYIPSLMRLIETQSKTTLIGWAVGYAEENLLPVWFRSYPDDNRPAKINWKY